MINEHANFDDKKMSTEEEIRKDEARLIIWEAMNQRKPFEQIHHYQAIKIVEQYGAETGLNALKIIEANLTIHQKDLWKMLEKELNITPPRQIFDPRDSDPNDKPFYITPENLGSQSVRDQLLEVQEKDRSSRQKAQENKINEIKRTAFERYGEQGFQLACEIFEIDCEMSEQEFWEEFSKLSHIG